MNQIIRPMSGSMRLLTNSYTPRTKAKEGENKDGKPKAASGVDRVRAGVASGAHKYYGRDSNAGATCLVLSKTNYGKEVTAGKPSDVSVTLLLLKVTRHAKGYLDTPMETTDGSMCLPPYASMWYKSEIDRTKHPETPEYYPSAQIVLSSLDKDKRDAMTAIKGEQGKRYIDERGTFNPHLSVIPMMLEGAKLSDYARTHYLPSCLLGNVPSCAKNGTHADKSMSTFVDMPVDSGKLRSLAEKLLQDERVANLVVYLIHLVAKATKLEEAIYIHPGQAFELNMTDSATLQPYSVVDISGIGSRTSIDPLIVRFRDDTSEIDDKYTLYAKVRGEGVTPNKQYPHPFQPYVVLYVRDKLGLCNSTLLPIDALARSMQIDPESKLKEKQQSAKAGKKKPDDINLLMKNMFFMPGNEIGPAITRAVLDPENYKAVTIVAFEPRVYAEGDQASPWCTKAVEKPPKPSRNQVDLSIIGFQCHNALSERIAPLNTNAMDADVLSQAVDDDSMHPTYKLFYEELTRIDGTLGSMGEALLPFGLHELETKAWKALAPVLFKFIQGSVDGYIKYFKSRGVALNVPKEILAEEEAGFLTSHSITDPVTGRKYMLVKESELAYAIDIMTANASTDVVYSAMASNWLFDYAAAIAKIGMHVSREVATQFLKNQKRPSVKVLPVEALSNGGVYIANEEKDLPKEENADSFQYRIIFPTAMPEDAEEIAKALEFIELVTPAVSNIIFKKEFYDKRGVDRTAILNQHGINTDVDDLTATIKTGDGYLFILPKDHKKSFEADVNKLLSFFAAEGAGMAATANAIEGPPGAAAGTAPPAADEKDKKGSAPNVPLDNSAGKISDMDTDMDTSGDKKDKKRKVDQITPLTQGENGGDDEVSPTQPYVEDAPAPKRTKLDLPMDNDFGPQ